MTEGRERLPSGGPVRFVALVALSLLSLIGATAEAGAAGDDAAVINVTCAACHGEHGQGSRDGTYPRLAGLRAAYLAKQLRLFKAKQRINIPMLPYATERDLPEREVLAISAFLSGIELASKLPPVDAATYDPLARLNAAKRMLNIPKFEGDAVEGQALYDRECASCHGADGLGKVKNDVIYPRLAGQHSLYIKRQFKEIAAGRRFHDEADDAAVFASFSDREVDNVLAYLSLLDD